jgi:arylsulfatase A-like enzyme
MRILLFVAFAASQIACSTTQESTTQQAADLKPNIIFIMADDLGYGDLGSYGQEFIQTPHLDQMAAEGVRFTNVYAGSPVCAPSRSVLMTGQHTGHTTVRGNMVAALSTEANPQGRVPLLNEDTTIAEVLKEAGYVTGITGKWGLGEPGSSGLPNQQGFHEWFGYLNQRRAHHYYVDYLWKNNEKYVIEENADGAEQVYSHDLFAQFALDFIERHQDTSFFLYLPYTIPHDEYEVPSLGPYADMEWQKDEKTYAAMVTRMDSDIGEMMQKLQALGIHNQTIVFFCSDNGAAKRWDGRFNSSAHLRGRKRDMYEGGIRTPMIVHYPAGIAPRTDSTGVWYFADVLPTLAAIAGASTPEDIDGKNVWPQITGENEWDNERLLYWEFYENGFDQAARWGKWKAVKLGNQSQWELYDLHADEAETTNVADANPEVVDKIADMVQQERRESPYWRSDV